ncbi:hypothetical protein GN956_G11650 [Arapaima gigas]
MKMKYDKDGKDVCKKRTAPGKKEDVPKMHSSSPFEDMCSPQKENEEEAIMPCFIGGRDLNNSVQEDSGYLSLHTSQLEHEEHDFGATEHCGELQEKHGCPLGLVVGESACEARQSRPKLPQLEFQRAVCQRLSKSHGKIGGIPVESIETLAQLFGLEKVIGGKMGVEYVDILQELWQRDMKHILLMILSRLADLDLINCSKVSRRWQKIISQDECVFKRYKAAVQKIRESRRAVPMTTRDFVTCRSALSCLQGLASNPVQRGSKKAPPQKVCKQSKNSSRQTRYNEYQEAASTLKQHESLKSCKRCGSPAKCNPEALRATCTRQSCRFDFCTQCLCEYHGSSPCLLLAPGMSSSRDNPIIGSSRSKRNVKRL